MAIFIQSDKKLRLRQNSQVLSVSEGHLDEFIIQSLQKLHRERESNGFIKSARLIGEVIGHSLQVVGDDL